MRRRLLLARILPAAACTAAGAASSTAEPAAAAAATTAARVSATPTATSAPTAASAAPGAASAPVVRPRELHLPADLGAHPEFRTEWWYVTGWLEVPGAVDPYGFQLTFFRSRTDLGAASASRFAARQLVIGHVALTDPAGRRLRHDQRVARSGLGIAYAREGDTDVRLRDWTLLRRPDAAAPGGQRYLARLDAPTQGFGLDFVLTATQEVLLQGENGVSRKGPRPEQASYYLSEPQLAVGGTLALDGRSHPVRGRAWLDHEWSEAPLDPQAAGWDWIGMNLDDGGALMAIRIRRRDGGAFWGGGSFRAGAGRPAQDFAADAVRFTPLRVWKSPATQASYPVEWRIDTPAGRFEVRARLDDQEIDARASAGAVYWEGLSDLFDAAGRRVGRGYLEMTGYVAALKLG